MIEELCYVICLHVSGLKGNALFLGKQLVTLLREIFEHLSFWNIVEFKFLAVGTAAFFKVS